MLAAAWREYLEHHRDQFAADLELAAKLLRDGTADQLAEFTSRFARERAEQAARSAREPRSG